MVGQAPPYGSGLCLFRYGGEAHFRAHIRENACISARFGIEVLSLYPPRGEDGKRTMPDQTYYITTPIYYVNDKPHLGHAYTTIMCDIIRRYQDLLGYETFFLTGTDEHGENIFRVARDAGRDVMEMVDANSNTFRELWPQLEISNDDFIRTTQERHKKVVQGILQLTYDQGDIYQREYTGKYCVKCERFYTDKEAEGEGEASMCPIHKLPLEEISETNYFFRLGKYQDWLREKIESDPMFLQPEQYRSEVLALLREPLDDLCISRPVERMHWGIPLPFDKDFVTYVWYDALVNYISAIGYPDGEKFAKFWPNSTHMTAKDILRQHAVYWPCFLEAAGIPCYRRLRVHGWWTVEGEKMSKTRGNVRRPLAEVGKYGLDVFRYYLAREMTFGSDGDYSAAGLTGRNNAELADDLGNLLSRVTAMIGKYFDGKMPALESPTEEDSALLAEIDSLVEELPHHIEVATIHTFLSRVIDAVGSSNRYVTVQAPWTLAKEGRMDRVGTILAVTCQMLAGAAQLLYPVMPGKMAQLLSAFGLDAPTELRNEPIPEGTQVQIERGLFPQLEVTEDEPESSEEAPEEPESQAPPVKPEITFEDFMKVDLRVATILEAEAVPKTDKLVRLSIDIGVEKRQIVAGVAEHYKPEALVGRQIVVVANLAPRQLRGLTSQGMLLAARDETQGGLFLLKPDDKATEGSEVS